MNHSVSLLMSVLSGLLLGVVKSDDGLIAINDASSVRTLYRRIGNEDAPSPYSDRASTDANIRRRLCEEITGSGYFTKENMLPVNMNPDILSMRMRDEDEIFSRIYAAIPQQRNDSSVLKMLPSFLSSRKQKPQFEYRNEFAPREFEFSYFQSLMMRRSEHVFVCLLEDRHEGVIYPYYVSKEYNVVGDPFRGGRFIFSERGTKPSTSFFTLVLLAEEPAKVFVDNENPKFDLELKYLERRHDLPLAPDYTADPVCSLLSESASDNEEDRLCAMVLTSSEFQRTTRVQYPESWYMGKCSEITVSFKSAEAKKIVGQKIYRERALRCHCRNPAHNNSYDYFYIVRAYVPHEVFVLEHDFQKGKIFLKNLTIDVGIIRGGVTVE